MSASVTRLFTQFQPEHYDLALELDRANMSFRGQITITGRKTGRPSKRLTFHAKDLKITSASVSVTDKKGLRDVAIERINLQKSFHEVRLHASEMLYPGKYTVQLDFEAPITPGMTGLYPCYYKLENQEFALLATQFESHHAREVFPCIDEPEAKATFDLTLVTEPGVTALGNTPVKSQVTTDPAAQTASEAENNTEAKMTTTFETTPRMSSYLLAFVVGDMQSKSAKTTSGVEVSVWSTRAQPIDSLDFGLDAAVRSIEFFEDYFGVAYPLPKAEHVALPDFSSGAMENWGLITYRERVLLAYPGESSQSIKETIALVVAHETSHQWFGNLVTMKWWNDLWLNESFANMMEYQAVDAMFPEWHVWDTFVAAEGLSALRRDATPGVQAVRVEVNHPDEISTLFDPSIVYAKGGRLLYMLKSYIGDDNFRKGLSQYFTKFAYKNTEGSDLWKELSDVSGVDVAAFMNPWLERPGFPVVTVSQNGKTASIGQRHFSDNPDKADKARIWPVPLFAGDGTTLQLLDSPSIEVELTSDDPLHIDKDARGHYIVNYSQFAHRGALASRVAAGTLSNAERLMLLNDNSMLSRAGYRPFGDVLSLLAAYGNESNESVWDIMSLIVGESRRFVDGSGHAEELEKQIKSFIRGLIAEQFDRLGWDEQSGESAADQKLRALIIGLGSYADEPAIIEQAKQRFTAYQSDPSSLSSEIRAIVFGVPIKLGDDTAFEFLLQLHDSTSNSDLKADISGALTATRSADKAKLLLERIKDPKIIKPQDADRWLVYLMRNRYVRDVGWNFMVDEWSWIEETYKNDKSYDYMPRYAAAACNSHEWAAKYKDFFEPKLDQVVLKRNILIGIEEINNRVNWLERDLASVEAFFGQ
ncbi:MAG TPA: M1 family metallopeptidase [Candidatus Saccharimonadales bacterium]|jgi:aminopeptidase N